MKSYPIGVMITCRRDTDLTLEIQKAKDLKLDSCQLCIWDTSLFLDDAYAAHVRDVIANADFRITTLWAGWSGPCEWNFTAGPATIGLVPAAYRFQRLQELKNASDFAEKIGVSLVATHVGFLPEKKAERRALLQQYASARETLLFHCAPQDADEYIALLFEALGERRACAVREITKLHEESVPFLLSQGLPGEKRGEYVLVVEGAGERENPLNALPVREHVLHYMRAGLEKKEALKRAAKDRGVSKSELYKETLDL